jgi:hypothetical protein
MTPGRLFILGLLAFGVLVGLVVTRVPEARALPVPAITWPFVVAFLAEFALMPLVREGRIPPITMGERFVAVFGSALIVTGMLALQPS